MRKQTVLLILISFIALTFFALSACTKKDVVKEGEAGVVIGSGGTIKVYSPGEVPSLSLFGDKYYLIATQPEVITFADDKSIKVASSGPIQEVGSQITYFISDVSIAVKEFGVENIQSNISDAIRTQLELSLKEEMKDAGSLQDDKAIPLLTARVHVNLNEKMKSKGLSITNFQLGF